MEAISHLVDGPCAKAGYCLLTNTKHCLVFSAPDSEATAELLLDYLTYEAECLLGLVLVLVCLP